jgi:hypothetical protein
MGGIISEKGKTKLIFFAVDDESILPKKQEMREYFSDCSYNIYKAWGHFRYTLEKIETIFRVKRFGIEAIRSYHPQDRIFTHVYCINTDVLPNSFFSLRYSSLLRGFYEIGDENMSEIETLLDSVRKQYELMEKIKSYIDRFEDGAKLAKVLGLKDRTMSNPDRASIDRLFKNYGKNGEHQLLEKINQFTEKIKWQ